MWMSRICRSPDSVLRCLRSVAWLAISLLALIALPTGLCLAETGGIQVVDSSHRTEFATQIEFRLSAASEAPIDRVALYRQLEGEIVRARSEIDVHPARQVEVAYVWEMEPGELTPGTEVGYWWLIENSASETLVTEPVSLSYVDDRFEWSQVSRQNVGVEFYGSGRERAEDILDAAWDAAQRLEGRIGVAVVQPVTIFVYANQSDMRPVLSPRGSVYDDKTVTLGLASGDDTLIILGSHSDVLQTVAHEMSHIVVGLATDNPYTDLPRWLDEGLAMYAEGSLPRDNDRALQRAIRRDQLISVRSLSAYVGDPDQVDLFYGEVYSLVAFMLDSFEQDAMADLLAVFRTGILAEDAVRQVYGFGQDHLDDVWRESLGLAPRGQTPGEQRSPESGDEEALFCFGPAGAMIAAALGLIVLSRKP